jgi:hypothetical protein
VEDFGTLLGKEQKALLQPLGKEPKILEEVLVMLQKGLPKELLQVQKLLLIQLETLLQELGMLLKELEKA